MAAGPSTTAENQRPASKVPSIKGLRRTKRRIAAMKAEQELRVLEIEDRAMQMAHAAVALESWSIMGDTFVNRQEYLPSGWGFDARTYYGVDVHNTLRDREQGSNRPFIEDELDSQYVRGLARWIAGATGPGVGIGENLKNYVIKKGFKFSAAARRNRTAPQGLFDDITAFVVQLLKRNKWQCDLDRELYWRWERDGDALLALYYQADGLTDMRVVEPEQIVDPRGRPWEDRELATRFRMNIPYATNWTYGIHKADHDSQTVYGYCVQWSSGEAYDYLPARMVVHWKANVDRNQARGISSFYPIWQWLHQQEKLLRNTAKGATRSAAIAYIIQYAQATGAKVKSMLQGQAGFSSTRPTSSGNIEQTTTADDRSDIVHVPKGQEYVDGPHSADRGQAFLEIVQGLLRQCATRFCMPEGMVSGDDQGQNYATAVEAGGRFHNFCEARQGMTAAVFLDIIWRCVEHAYNRGWFRKWHSVVGTWGAFQDVVDLLATPPDVQPKDNPDTTSKRQTLNERGILSNETWSELEGLDPAQERDRGAERTITPEQLTAVMTILAAAQTGSVPAGSVGPLLTMLLPNHSTEEIQAIVAPLMTAQATQQAGQPASGGFVGMGRKAWTNNRKAIYDVLQDVADGKQTTAQATIMLTQLGMPPELAQQYLTDASDGSVDTFTLAESAADDLLVGRGNRR